MRTSSYTSSAPSPVRAFVVILAIVLLVSPQQSIAKRFDCQMFCRTTGFSGMVGGCRCSFTLFTAKRSTRDHNSVLEEAPSYLDEEKQYPNLQELSLVDLLRMARETHEAQLSAEDDQEEEQLEGSKHNLNVVRGMPKAHPARVLVKPSAGASSTTSSSTTQHRSNRLGRSPSQLLAKRQEFEQDLDNGDTSDFLRLPY